MRAARWAERVFGLTLRLHPREFREAYGAEMRACFADGWRGAPGGRARVGLLLRSMRVAFGQGMRQRWSTPGGPRGRGGDVWRLDLRHAVHALVRRPALAALIVATLGIGIGANAAVFGTLYSVVLQPLPYPEPDRLLRLYQFERDDDAEQFGGYLTLPALVDFREKVRTLSGIAAVYTYDAEGADLTGVGRPERLRVLRVGADYFDVLGVRPASGRAFRRDEELGVGRTADAPVAIVSAALAERLGATVTLDGRTYDVVGTMPADFADPLMGAQDVWLPLALPVGGYENWEWDNHYLSAIARLAPGRTLEEARAEIDYLSTLQEQQSPDADGLVGHLVPLHADVVGESDTLLTILMGAVGLLLLLTFVNVAVLLVARSLERAHEVAVRTALGSPRGRLVRQYLFEGLALASAGGVAGALVALPLQRLLALLAPAGALDRAATPSAWPILGFGMLAALLAGTVFGLAPALGLRRVDPTGALRQAGRGTDHRVAARIREALVVVQVAMALVLLIGAGVLLKSLDRLRSVDMNLRVEQVLAFEANLPEARYAEADVQRRFREDLAHRIEALPGVRAAGAISHLPVTGRAFTWGVRRAVGENEALDQWVPADQRVVSGAAFEVLGIPLVAGRRFGPQDGADVPPRVVVNEALASELFGDVRSALGQGIRVANVRREIIGIVANVPVGARGEVAPMVYHWDRQYSAFWTRSLVHVVATEPGNRALLDGITRAVAALDGDLVVHRPRALADVIGTGRARERFAATLLAAFAALAVALSALGLYGILSHAVRRRRREIGIRLALGAQDRTVLGMMLRQGLGTAAIGVVLGVLGGWAATRALSALVFGVGVRDPWVFAAAAAAMTAVAALASALPALRAVRVNPVETFRGD